MGAGHALLLCACVSQVSILYYTDPACPISWAAEPGRRCLQREFGESVSITYVMGGLARRFDDPVGALGRWLDAAASAHMPVDPRLWLDAPPAGSYPACLAVVAAAEQGLDGPYLRGAREALAFGGQRLDHREALVDVARRVAAMNVERFEIDLGSHAILEGFGTAMDRARAGERGLPRLELRGPGELSGELQGRELLDPRAWARAARAAGATGGGAAAAGVVEAVAEHGRLATAEVAQLCDLPAPRAAAELWQATLRWRLRPETHLAGETWTLA